MRVLSATSASLVGLVLLSGAACSSGGDEVDPDTRAEQVPELTPCPVVTRAGGCRAATSREVVTIASEGLLLPAAGFSVGDGFLAFGVRWGDARIVTSKSPRSWVFDAADTLPWDAANGATGVTTRGKHVLYFLAALEGAPSLHAATLRDGVLEAPSPVALDGAYRAPSWPQAVALADGRVLLAFVVPQQQVMFGVDDGTGLHFTMRTAALEEPDLTGVLAHVGTTARGSWLLTYQVADAAWRFRSHVLVSRDEGASWSRAQAGALSAGEPVADAFPLARRDQGADVYYVKQKAVFRRVLSEDGSLGKEQAVTSSELGAVAKPQPRRLPDGRIALMLTLQRTSTAKDLALVVLDGDAPP